MIEKLVKRKRKQIEDLASRGISPVDVATAIGLTPAQYAQVATDDEHLFNTIYWTAKTKYVNRLYSAAINIIENGTDDSVKAKLIEFLTNEHHIAAENKRLTVGYTNIKKLVSLIRKQKDENGFARNEVTSVSPTGIAHKQRKANIVKEILDGKAE